MQSSSLGIATRLFTRVDWLVFASITGFSLVMVVFFFLAWLSLGDWPSHPGSFLILTLVILARVSNSLIRLFALPFMKRPQPANTTTPLKVGVVTTIVPGQESLEML